MKKSLSLFAALLLLFSVSAFAEAAEMPAYQPVPDFTVTLISGETFTLSEVLTRKKAVLINLWATWCGPCEKEFPYLQEAYEAYRDSVEVIALSVERGDSTEILTAYAQSHGLTFPVGSDTGVGLADRFVSRGIPTSVLVDRFGNTVLVEVGAQTSSYGFMAAFEQLTGDDYTESRVFSGFPRPVPPDPAGQETPAALAAGLAEAESPDLRIAFVQDENTWPFLASEEDGKPCIASTNANVDNSSAELLVSAAAAEGDAFSFRAKVSCEEGYDRFRIFLNGGYVRSFSGESGWFSFALMLPEGENEIRLVYRKDMMEAAGADRVCLADFALLHGEEAAAAAAANPAEFYPYAEKTGFEFANDSVREIAFFTPDGELFDMNSLLGTADTRFYIIPDEDIRFTATLSRVMEWDDMTLVSNGGTWNASDILEGELHSGRGDEDYDTLAILDNYQQIVYAAAFVFPDEETASSFEAMLAQEADGVRFRYLDE